MKKKIRIKDIATMAGVSAGTVDRILHNRGNVAPSKKKAVEKILREVDYRPNIHLSAISIKKNYRIAISMPQYVSGQYWAIVASGITRAVKEFDSLDISFQYFLYDQFDLYSCRKAFNDLMALEELPDAVIVGPAYLEETLHLAEWLQTRDIPYVYVDNMIEGTSPLAFFAPNQYRCGYLVAKLIDAITPDGSHFALLSPSRIGVPSATAASLRKFGFRDFCTRHNIGDNIHEVPFTVNVPPGENAHVTKFFRDNPHVKGAVVLMSRGHAIAEIFSDAGITDVKLVSLDLPAKTIAALKTGAIDYVVAQRPAQQGFMAVRALVQHLLYKTRLRRDNYMPLDIITAENLDYYSEFTEGL